MQNLPPKQQLVCPANVPKVTIRSYGSSKSGSCCLSWCKKTFFQCPAWFMAPWHHERQEGHLNAYDTLFYCQYFIVKRLNYSQWPCSRDRNKEWMDYMMVREKKRVCVCEVLRCPLVNNTGLLTSHCFQLYVLQINIAGSKVEGNN